MSFALLQLIVLGKIPGTHIVIDFWALASAVLAISILLLFWKLLRISMRLLRKIDPFRRAPKELTIFDLTAL